MLRDRAAIAQQREQDLQEQTQFADSDVNLSACVPEVGMLQPEALSEASSLPVPPPPPPPWQSAGNHVNSGGEGRH